MESRMKYPTRHEVLMIARAASVEMSCEDAQKVLEAVSDQRVVVYGKDIWCGYSCPLKAAGFTRRSFGGPWTVRGGSHFEYVWDAEMYKLVGLDVPRSIRVNEDEKES